MPKTTTTAHVTAATTDDATDHHAVIPFILRLDSHDLKLLDMAAKKKKLSRTEMTRKLIRDGLRRMM